MRLLLSWAYWIQANVNWRMLFMHIIPWALALDLVNAGSSSAARMAMIAITTSSSINVNAHEPGKANVGAPVFWTALELWSAPAKRSGDGALTVPEPCAERAKAGSRFACPRTPKRPAPQPNRAHPIVPLVIG